MSTFIESLRRLYVAKRVTYQKLTAIKTEGKITRFGQPKNRFTRKGLRLDNQR